MAACIQQIVFNSGTGSLWHCSTRTPVSFSHLGMVISGVEQDKIYKKVNIFSFLLAEMRTTDNLSAFFFGIFGLKLVTKILRVFWLSYNDLKQ